MKHFLTVILLIALQTGCTANGPCKVTRVIDGDTIEVNLNGKTERIRILGLDCPEMDTFDGEDAKQRMYSLVNDKTIVLQHDGTSKDRGYYGRLLRYVHVNNTDAGLTLIREGYCKDYTKYPHGRANRYRAAS